MREILRRRPEECADASQREPRPRYGFADQTIEVQPNGKKTYVLKMNLHGSQYRSYIYASMYGDPAATSLPSTPVPPRLARNL
jgi:hypothetical protein